MADARKCCTRCGLVILGPLTILEVSRIAHRSPECKRWLLCVDCADAIRNYLSVRPDMLDRLEPAESNP